MYSTLLILHSTVRWLVLVGLLYSIFRSVRGYRGGKTFSNADNYLRHWTATIAHIQLVIGVILYVKSPVIQYFYKNYPGSRSIGDMSFFGELHSTLMLIAVVFITIGSAKAKRKQQDKEKFRTMLAWFSTSLFVILIAIPWPFSPLANRPYFRLF